MAKLRTRTISRRTVEALKAGKDTVYWDSELPGFGIRVYPTGAKHYVVQTRSRGATKRLTVGRHGVIAPEEARRRAALIIARIKAGEAPVPEPLAAQRADEPTVAELAARYLEEYAELRCKPNTVTAYRQRATRHIVPALGKLPIGRVRREDVRDMHYGLRATPVMANRVVDLLSRMFNMAESWGLLPEGSNPCWRQVKYRERPRERFLTAGEFRRLGRVLSEAEGSGAISVHAAAAIRLLMLTGCRKNEILTLRWTDVDLEARELHLADSKTGARTISLSPEAALVLAGIPRVEGNLWVIPSRIKGECMRNIDHPWYIVRKRAGLNDVRLHDCRHSFASRALALGESLPAIGKLLGHAQVETTARYAHLARDSMHEAAARIAGSIAADIL